MTFEHPGIVEVLLDWYDMNKRILPWRDISSPYYTWVSEIMLQQTRVEAVRGYFYRFTKKLPDIEKLADEDEESLLKLWEGLGYYNRVRNMQKAAKIICESYNKQLPKDPKELMKLPGIGAYTAGAIASIAYNVRVPAVDGNVLRIVMRLDGCYDDIADPKTAKRITGELAGVIPERAGDFNQALMDLGAVVCLPSGAPKCADCPIFSCCHAYKEELTGILPVKKTKSARKIEEKTVFLIEYNDKYLINKRENKGLLAGLWELPNREGTITPGQLKELFSSDAEISSLGSAKHIFSHIEWRMTGYYIKLNTPPVDKETFLETVWADKKELEEVYSIPTAFNSYKKWK